MLLDARDATMNTTCMVPIFMKLASGMGLFKNLDAISIIGKVTDIYLLT